MDDAQLAFSVAKMKEYGIVDSGDSLKLGIGAMTDARQKSFFDKMVKAKLADPAMDYRGGLHVALRRQGRGPRHEEAVITATPVAGPRARR